MDERNMTSNVPATVTEEPISKFKGYSLEDLRYRRALVALQKEFAKSKIISNTHKLQKHSPFSDRFGEDNSTVGKVGLMAGKLLHGLNYIDYAILGFTLFKSTKKILGIFRKKK